MTDHSGGDTGPDGSVEGSETERPICSSGAVEAGICLPWLQNGREIHNSKVTDALNGQNDILSPLIVSGPDARQQACSVSFFRRSAKC